MFRGTKFDTGLSDSEWNQGWDRMKRDQTYEVPYFGDLFFMSMYLQNCGFYIISSRHAVLPEKKSIDILGWKSCSNTKYHGLLTRTSWWRG